MNKKIILLPLLILGLGLTACNPAANPDTDTGTGSETETEETPIWEEDLVDDETAISELNASGAGEYFMVRGTVVGKSGTTFSLARGDSAVYCYNFKPQETNGIVDFVTGNYIEVYAQLSEYEGSVQLTAYVDGAYDTNAYVEVLAEQGEEIAPIALTEANFSEVHVNANAGKLLVAEGLVNVSGSYTNDPNAREDAKFTLGSHQVTVRLEKYWEAEPRAAFIASIDALEATATYTIVAIMTASSGGGRLMLLDSSTVTKTAEPTEEPSEPAGPTEMSIADALAAEDGTKVIVTGTVGEIREAWSSYNNMSFFLTDGTNELLVWRTKTQVEQGDNITVTGDMTTYDGVRELINGTITFNETTGGETGGETGGDLPAGETITWAWGEPGGTTATQVSYSTTQVVYTSGGVTLTNDKASSTTDIRNCASSGDYALRVYKNSNLTISAEQAFVKIEITFDNYDNNKYVPANGDNGFTVEGDVGTITLTEAASTYTIESLTKQVRVKTVVLTLAA